MSLDALLKPFKWLDEKIQNQYTRIGRNIPDNHFYPINMALNIFGSLEGPMRYAITYLKVPDIPAVLLSAVVSSLDFGYNLEGLRGRIQREWTSEDSAVNPLLSYSRIYNKITRLPLFLTGVSFIGKSAYDLINNLTTGEPATKNTLNDAQIGIGFLLLASSMYLKDPNPKVPKKEKVKARVFERLPETS